MWIKVQCVLLCETYQTYHLGEDEHKFLLEQYKSGTERTRFHDARKKKKRYNINISQSFLFLDFYANIASCFIPLMTYETEQVQYAQKTDRQLKLMFYIQKKTCPS